ncbi:prevent host death protein [Synechococcus phage DSL-LC03]|nr:prevent host death protein [Synechococcus phage DSL-LC03]
MTEITVEELQEYFDDYIERVAQGETFLVKSVDGDVVLMPVDEYDDLIRIGMTD